MVEPGSDRAHSQVDAADKPTLENWAVGVDETYAPINPEKKGGPEKASGLKRQLTEAMGVTSEVSKKLLRAIRSAEDVLKRAEQDPIQITDENIAGMLRLVELDMPQVELIVSADEKDDYRALQELISEIRQLPARKETLIKENDEKVQKIVNSTTLANDPEGQPVSPEQLQQTEVNPTDLVPGPNGELLQRQSDGSAVAKTTDGKEIKFNPGAVLILLVLGLLMDGNHTIHVMADTVTDGITKHVMINFFGIDPEKVKGFAGHGEVSELYLFSLGKYQLKDFLEKMVWMGRRKIYTILENLPENTRRDLMAGKEVTRNSVTHKFEPELIGKILGVLSKDDLVRLRLDKVVSQQKTKA